MATRARGTDKRLVSMVNTSQSAHLRFQMPTWRLATSTLPRLLLGDHGFLRAYGSDMTIREVGKRMEYALAKATMGVAAGDERCLRAARRIDRKVIGAVPVMYHTDISLLVGSHRVTLQRAMSSLYGTLGSRMQARVEQDAIVGSFLKEFQGCRVYGVHEIQILRLNQTDWHREALRIRTFRPAAVSVGGDFLDFAFAVGRYDLARSAFKQYRALCQELDIPLILTSYIGCASVAKWDLEVPPDLYDGLLIPLNSKGTGMLPDRDFLLEWARGRAKPVIAMHALGSGRIDVSDALRFVFRDAGAAAAVVGASTPGHIDALVSAAAEVFLSRG